MKDASLSVADNAANTFNKAAQGNIDGVATDFIAAATMGVPFDAPLRTLVGGLPFSELQSATSFALEIKKSVLGNTNAVYQNDYAAIKQRIVNRDPDFREYLKYALIYDLATANWSDPNAVLVNSARNQYEAYLWYSAHKPGKLGVIRATGNKMGMTDQAIYDSTQEMAKQFKELNIKNRVAAALIGHFVNIASQKQLEARRVCGSDLANAIPLANNWWASRPIGGSDLANAGIPSGAKFEFRDLKHDKAIVGGIGYDGIVRHQKSDKRGNGLWTLTDTGHNDCSFHMKDAIHKVALVAGDTHYHAEDIYHQHPNNRDNSRWELLRFHVDGAFMGYLLRDKKHYLCVVGGDTYDGILRHMLCPATTFEANRPKVDWKPNILWGIYTESGQRLSP